ncbi:MAG: T9SS type A sorting domain-containing protein [Balneolaceae bacterium]
MKIVTINNIITLITSCLLLTFLTSSMLSAQVIVPPDEPNDLIDLPFEFNMDSEEIDWEGYTFFPFAGAALERIENPDKSGLNETDYVLQYIKAGGDPWAGFFYHTDGIMEGTDEAVFRLKVWSNRAGIRALLKLEMRQFPDVNTGDLFVDIDATGEWIELEWDLSGIDRDTPFDRVVVIFDLEGGSGDGSDPFIWLLDDFGFDDGQITVSTEITDAGIPQSVKLNQNYPNPFNPTTNIEFALSQNSHTTLEVFDMLGQKVATLVNGQLSAGQHIINFDASNLSSGTYLYRLQAGNEVLARKLTLIK